MLSLFSCRRRRRRCRRRRRRRRRRSGDFNGLLLRRLGRNIKQEAALARQQVLLKHRRARTAICVRWRRQTSERQRWRTLVRFFLTSPWLSFPLSPGAAANAQCELTFTSFLYRSVLECLRS